MKINLLFSISLILTLLGRPLMAGPEGSGGSDDYTLISAWFKSYYDESKSVKGCFEVAPDFGVSHEELSGMVRSSFNMWSSYLVDKNLIGQIPVESNKTPNSFNKMVNQVVLNSYRIATELELDSNCKGDEDLKFYFGTEDEKVKRARAKYEKPFGFAELNRHDSLQQVWSPGFIWIANSKSVYPEQGIPSWNTSKESLRGLILHELGHVFGNGHVRGTVMTPDLAKYLTNDTRPGAKDSFLSAYSSIDSSIELVPCYECQVSYSSKSESEYLVEAFRLLAHRDPRGRLSARLTREGLGSSEIVLIDETGEHHFPIVLSDLIAKQTDSTPRFLGLGGRYFASEGRSYLGEIQTPDGNNILVAVNYNMNQQKISVKTLKGKGSQVLFVN